MKKIKKLSKNKKIILVSLLVLIVGAIILIFTQYYPNSNKSNEVAESPNTSDQSQSTNDNSNEIKKEIVESQKNEQNNSSQTGIKKITPLITFAEQVNNNIEVAAFVPNISEDGGTCTAVLTQNQSTIAKTVPANRNTATTDCSAFTIPRSDFPNSGDWNLIVSYKSTFAIGSSDTWALKVK